MTRARSSLAQGVRFTLWALDLEEPLTWHAVCAHWHVQRALATRWIRAYRIGSQWQ